MKNFKITLASLLLALVTTVMIPKDASAQSTTYFTFSQVFDVTSLASVTTPLADDTKYGSVGGPIAPVPCDNGAFFCGVKVVISSGSLSATDRQAIWNAIKAQADARKASSATPLIFHNPGTPLAVPISGSRTANVTTYLKS